MSILFRSPIYRPLGISRSLECPSIRGNIRIYTTILMPIIMFSLRFEPSPSAQHLSNSFLEVGLFSGTGCPATYKKEFLGFSIVAFFLQALENLSVRPSFCGVMSRSSAMSLIFTLSCIVYTFTIRPTVAYSL